MREKKIRECSYDINEFMQLLALRGKLKGLYKTTNRVFIEVEEENYD